MSNRIIAAVAAILATLFLAGCAGQGFYVAAQDAKNPYNFIQVAGRIPTPLALCIKDEGDIFKVSCESGQLNMRKVDGSRQYSCVQSDGKTTRPSKAWVPYLTREVCPMGIIDQKQSNGGGGQCVPSPQIPGVPTSQQPQYWGNCQ